MKNLNGKILFLETELTDQPKLLRCWCWLWLSYFKKASFICITKIIRTLP